MKKIITMIMFFINLSIFAEDGLKKMVGIVKEQYSESQKEIWKDFIKKTEDEPYISKSIQEELKNKSFGSGFLYKTSENKKYIFTNSHVVPVADFASVEFLNDDNSFTKIENLKVLLRDEELDIAVIEFPDEENKFNDAFVFFTKKLNDGEEVFSAGFPGLGNSPVWQFGVGSITNASVNPIRYFLNPSISTVIQHSAPIDPGNSGGPLLIKDSSSKYKYSVVGMNTWQAAYRQSANYSTPSKVLLDFFEKNVNSHSKDQLQKDLEKKADRFIKELNTKDSNFTFITKYLSHSLITKKEIDELYKSINNPNENDSWKAKRFTKNYTTLSTIYLKADKIWKDFNTIEKKSDSKDQEYSENEEDAEIADNSFFVISNVNISDYEGKVTFFDEYNNSIAESKWLYEEGTWKLTDIYYKEFGKKKLQEPEKFLFNKNIFKIGAGKDFRTTCKDYDKNEIEPKIYPSFFFSLILTDFKILNFGFSYDYQITEIDTLKLWGLFLDAKIPVKIKSFEISPFARISGLYSIFSDDAIYGWNAEGGIDIINRKKTHGIGCSVKYTDIHSINRNGNNYRIFNANAYLIFAF